MIDIVKKQITINLGPDAGKTAYYAAFSRKGTANSIEIAQQMKEGSSAFTLGEVVGITLDLPARIKQALLAGQAVRIDGLGVFKPSLSTNIQMSKEALKTSHVSIKSINFVPDADFIAQLNAKAQYEWIEPNKAAAEDADSTDTASGTDTATTPANGNAGDSDAGNGDGPIITDHGVEF